MSCCVDMELSMTAWTGISIKRPKVIFLTEVGRKFHVKKLTGINKGNQIFNDKKESETELGFQGKVIISNYIGNRSLCFDTRINDTSSKIQPLSHYTLNID